MSRLKVDIIPYFDDNFSYLFYFDEAGPKALVDCGDAEPVLTHLNKKGWQLDFMLATHSHYDHAEDIPVIQKEFPNLTVIKPKGESRISAPGQEVADGDTISFGNDEIRVIGVPAHTNYCVSYLISGAVFVGDALFSAGCGRLFEGQAEDLERAMDKLKSLPDETRVYFGHEYTVSNLRFAKSVEPTSSDILNYLDQAESKISRGEHTTPSTISLEKKINPFFRIDETNVIRALDPNGALTRTKRMAALRKQKDNF
jgi:hydroxyacylglutathione hydrolase